MLQYKTRLRVNNRKYITQPSLKYLIVIKTTSRRFSKSAYLSMDDPNERSHFSDWGTESTTSSEERRRATTASGTESTTGSEQRRRVARAISTWEAGNCDDRSSTNPTSQSDVKASVGQSDSESDTAKDEYYPERKSITGLPMTSTDTSKEIAEDILQMAIYKQENDYIDNDLRDIAQKLHAQKSLGKQVLSEEEHLKLSDFIAKHKEHFEGKINQHSFEDGLNSLHTLNKARQVELEKHESQNLERLVSTLEKECNSSATNADNSNAAKTDNSNTDVASSKAESNTSKSKPSLLADYADPNTEPFDPFDPDA